MEESRTIIRGVSREIGWELISWEMFAHSKVMVDESRTQGTSNSSVAKGMKESMA